MWVPPLRGESNEQFTFVHSRPLRNPVSFSLPFVSSVVKTGVKFRWDAGG